MASGNKSFQLIDITNSIVDTNTRREKFAAHSKLTAAYCLALLKAKASQRFLLIDPIFNSIIENLTNSSEFDPAAYLPQECLNNSKLIMPHHLQYLLEKWNLELSSTEFNKLWQRFP